MKYPEEVEHWNASKMCSQQKKNHTDNTKYRCHEEYKFITSLDIMEVQLAHVRLEACVSVHKYIDVTIAQAPNAP